MVPVGFDYMYLVGACPRAKWSPGRLEVGPNRRKPTQKWRARERRKGWKGLGKGEEPVERISRQLAASPQRAIS